MLAYAFQTLKPDSYETIAKTEFDNIHNMFASILAAGIGKQLKQASVYSGSSLLQLHSFAAMGNFVNMMF